MSNTIINTIAHRITDISTTNATTGETTTSTKAVNLKGKDFADKAEYAAYNRMLLRLTPKMQALAAYDLKDDAALKLRKDLTADVQAVAKYLWTTAGDRDNAPTIQKRDIDYIVRTAYARKMDKDKKEIVVNVKSKSAIQTLLEDVLYYHANGMRVPNVGLGKGNTNALDKLANAEAEEKARAKLEKTKPDPEPESKKPEVAEVPESGNPLAGKVAIGKKKTAA